MKRKRVGKPMRKRIITFDGLTGTTDEIAAQMGIPKNQLMQRLFYAGVRVSSFPKSPTPPRDRRKPRNCQVCGNPFFGNSSQQLFCGKKCKRVSNNERRPLRPKKPTVVGNCIRCGEAFVKRQHSHRLCSDKCRAEVASEREWVKSPPKPKVETLMVCEWCKKDFIGPRFGMSTCHNSCTRALNKNKRILAGEHPTLTAEAVGCRTCGKPLPSPRWRAQKSCSRKCQERYDTSQSRRLPSQKIRYNLSKRLSKLVVASGWQRTGSVLKYIGCSIEKLREHVESQFTRGMTWEGYGVNGWHFDHLIPCSWFDLNRENHVSVCFNWQNIRPLQASKNCIKRDVMTESDWRQVSDELMLMASSVGINEGCVTSRFRE